MRQGALSWKIVESELPPIFNVKRRESSSSTEHKKVQSDHWKLSSFWGMLGSPCSNPWARKLLGLTYLKHYLFQDFKTSEEKINVMELPKECKIFHIFWQKGSVWCKDKSEKGGDLSKCWAGGPNRNQNWQCIS